MPAKKKTTKKKTATKKSQTKKVAKKSTKKVTKKTTKKSAPKKADTVIASPHAFDEFKVPADSHSTTQIHASHPTVTRGRAIISIIANLVVAGAGTLLIKEYASGIIQLLLAVVSVVLFMTTQQIPIPLIIATIALVWSLINSINAFFEAKQ